MAAKPKPKPIKKQLPLTKAPADKGVREIKRKWGAPLHDAGWTALPNVIFQRQRALGLTAIDISILLHLAAYWWKAENLPYPGKKSIAAAMGISPRHVQRRIAHLEKGGLIRRRFRKTGSGTSQTNIYDFAGLIKEATPFAKEAIQAKEKRQAASLERFAKKKPAFITG